MSNPSDNSSGLVRQPPKLLDQVQEGLQVRHYSLRTEQAYLHWIKRFILFHGKRDLCEMVAPEVEAFLSDLAVRQNVSASAQNLDLAAVLFLYRGVLLVDLPWLENVVRAKKPRRLLVVLNRAFITIMVQSNPTVLP